MLRSETHQIKTPMIFPPSPLNMPPPHCLFLFRVLVGFLSRHQPHHWYRSTDVPRPTPSTRQLGQWSTWPLSPNIQFIMFEELRAKPLHVPGYFGRKCLGPSTKHWKYWHTDKAQKDDSNASWNSSAVITKPCHVVPKSFSKTWQIVNVCSILPTSDNFGTVTQLVPVTELCSGCADKIAKPE